MADEENQQDLFLDTRGRFLLEENDDDEGLEVELPPVDDKVTTNTNTNKESMNDQQSSCSDSSSLKNSPLETGESLLVATFSDLLVPTFFAPKESSTKEIEEVGVMLELHQLQHKDWKKSDVHEELEGAEVAWKAIAKHQAEPPIAISDSSDGTHKNEKGTKTCQTKSCYVMSTMFLFLAGLVVGGILVHYLFSD